MLVIKEITGNGGWFFFKIADGVRIELHQSTELSAPIIAAAVINRQNWNLIVDNLAFQEREKAFISDPIAPIG